MQDTERNILPAVRAQGRALERKPGEYLLFHCLIVSGDPERQEMLSRAAAESGWETILCSDAASAVSEQRRKFVQLAIVDLEGDSCGEFGELLERFSSANGLLTVVCGTEGDMEEEIWIRQVGAWLYLPGVNESTDVSLLCVEAKHIVERMHAAAHTSAARKLPLRRAR